MSVQKNEERNERKTSYILSVPKEWNGKQAKAVWVFLGSIMEAIWDVHGEEIVDAAEDEQQKRLLVPSDELPEYDDFPF